MKSGNDTAMAMQVLLKTGMAGGLSGLLSSTEKPPKASKPTPSSASSNEPVHCNFLINRDIHLRMKYLAIEKNMSLREIVNEAMNEYLKHNGK